jgi:hypothetical protein
MSTFTATIANGTSLSGNLDIGPNATIVGILMPAAWTAAALTFKAGDGSNMGSVYNAAGEYSIPSGSIATGAATYLAIPPGDLAGCRTIAFRSGTSGSAVNQGADRVLTIFTQKILN